MKSSQRVASNYLSKCPHENQIADTSISFPGDGLKITLHSFVAFVVTDTPLCQGSD